MGICVLTIKRSFAGGFSFKMLDAFFAKKTPRHGRRPIGTLVPWRARHEDAPTGVWRQRDRNIAAISETVWMMTSFKAFFFRDNIYGIILIMPTPSTGLLLVTYTFTP